MRRITKALRMNLSELLVKSRELPNARGCLRIISWGTFEKYKSLRYLAWWEILKTHTEPQWFLLEPTTALCQS